MKEPRPATECFDPALRDRMTSYCFQDRDSVADPEFEVHLLECDECWDEFQRLERAVRRLRADEPLTRQVLARDYAAVVGMSARLGGPLGGHSRFVLFGCVGLGILYGLALLSEVAYAFDRLGATAMVIAPLLAVGVAALGMGGLALDARRTRAGRHDGLSVSVLMFTAAAALVLLCVWPILPAEPIVRATFQTFTARAGMLKAVCYFLPLSIAMICVPFHFVAAMQREIGTGRSKLALNVLTGQGLQILPRGVFFPGVRLLSVLLAAVAVAALYGLAHLFERLEPTPYMNLFMLLAMARTALFFVLALGCLAWYYRSLNELTHEAASVEASRSQDGIGPIH